MTRIRFMCLIVLWPALLWAQRPNVLFIAIDDLNLSLGCYGKSFMKTPNIDRLAQRGVRFDLTYCQYPLCNPSRASMLTGQRPDTIRVWDLQTNLRSTVPNVVTLPQLFRQNGYVSARVGKIFHYGVPREIGTPGMDDPPSWDMTFNPIGRDKTEEDQLTIYTRGTGSTTIGFAMAWREMDGSDDEQTDGKGTNKAIEYLEQFAKERRPFFLGMGYYRPHTPYVSTRQHFAQYPLNELHLPTMPADDLADIPPRAFWVKPPNYGLGQAELLNCVRGYYAAVSLVDSLVGRLVEALERLKLADNTIIVFFSDHGYLLGEHGQWQKQLLFDESARVPMIIVAPQALGNGKPCMRPVELLDVYPTLRELCNLPQPPQTLEGHSLVPLLNDPSAASERAIFSQVTRPKKVMAYSVRTQRWRYTDWGAGSDAELYDHDADPSEFHNLAKDPAQRQTIATLHNMLPAKK
jgi:uncharacterized sulfatase